MMMTLLMRKLEIICFPSKNVSRNSPFSSLKNLADN